MFAGVYTDEGISGLNTRHGEGFKRMLADALAGNIDLIVTKSVSRFARNTVDSLTTIRDLKSHGVEVYFEKENIWTLDGKGELLISIMSSLAQEESRSISDNVTWGQRKRFADGKVNMPYGQFLGYRKGPDGLPEINPEEAETVRFIYRLFMGGKTVNAIAKILTEAGVPTPRKKARWQDKTVESILTNEKYSGDAVLQKSFTVDFLSKKMKKNAGEVPQYIVTDSYPGIIDKAEWELVQAEMAKRKAKGRKPEQSQPFFDENLLRRVRELVRLEDMALDRQVPQGGLEMQRKVRAADRLQNSAFERSPDKSAVYAGALQAARAERNAYRRLRGFERHAFRYLGDRRRKGEDRSGAVGNGDLSRGAHTAERDDGDEPERVQPQIRGVRQKARRPFRKARQARREARKAETGNRSPQQVHFRPDRNEGAAGRVQRRAVERLRREAHDLP